MKAVLALCLLAVVAIHAQSEIVPALVKGDGDNGNAGLRITATQSGLNKFWQILQPLINKQFATIHLPDMKLDEHVPVIGHVTIEIKNIWIHNFNIPNGKVLTTPPADVSFEIGPGVHLHLKADFHWRKVHWPHLSGHGSIEANPDGGDIKIKVQITPGAGGHFHVHADAASCNFHSFNIKFHGGLSWLVNIFVRLFKEKIKKAIDDAVAKQIHSLIDKNMNEILGKIPTSYVIGHGASQFAVNIPLVQTTGNNNWLDLGFAFTVTNTKGGALCPIPIPDIPLVDQGQTGRNLQIFFGQHFFSCALWVNYQNGVIDQTLKMNTTDFWLIIPAIPSKYPACQLDVRITMQKLGGITITPHGMTAELPIMLNMTVHPHTGGLAHVAALSATATATFRAWVGKDAASHPTLFLNVTSMKLQLGVIDTQVGPIDLSLLQALSDILVPILTKSVDDLIAKGFIIPISKGIGLTNDVVLWANGYLGVEGDFHYVGEPVVGYDYPRVPEDDFLGDDVIRGV